MIKEDIIRMAREAGGTDRRTGWWDIHTEDLEHLVALVTERDTALLRQALEALESGDWYIDQLEMIVYSADDTGTHEERAKVQAAITALRERLGEKA